MGRSRSLWLAALATALVGLPPPALAAEKAEAVLRQAFEKLHRARSFSATMSATVGSDTGPRMTWKGAVSAMKPNYLRIALKGETDRVFVADGKSYFIQEMRSDVYFKLPLDANPLALQGAWEGEIDAFFGGAALLKGASFSDAGSTAIEGVQCQLVRVDLPNPKRTVTYAIGKKDLLIRRSTMVFEGAAGSGTQSNTLTGIRLNAPLTAAAFAYTPPKGARLWEPPNYEAKLIPVGQEAPDFSLPTPGEGRLSLKEASQGRQAVLLNFWFHG